MKIAFEYTKEVIKSRKSEKKTNTMAKRKMTKGQTLVAKTLHHSCSTIDTGRATLAIHLVIRHARGNDEGL